MSWGASSERPTDNFAAWFTNRDREQDHIRTLANAPRGARVPVQVYVGVSGAGKTHLRRKFEDVLRVAGVPCLVRDFDGDRTSLDPAALVARLIAAAGLEAPRTFLALLRLAMRQSESDLRALYDEIATDALGAAADAFLQHLDSFSAGGFLKSFAKYGLQKFRSAKDPLNRYLKTQEGRADSDWMHRATEEMLFDDLFRRFSLDLAVANPRPGHAVQIALLVDAYDFASQRESTQDERERSLAWIGELYRICCEEARDGWSARLLVVCFGQTQAPLAGLAEYVDEHRLDGFTRKDGEAYWRKRELPAVHFARALEEAREEGTDERYHVFSLGLAGDMVATSPSALAERETVEGLDKPAALARRFLRLLGDVDRMRLRKLALTSWWDDEAVAWAFGVAGDYEGTRTRLEWLQRFSFVQPMGSGRFTLHGAMRRALVETSEPEDLSHWHHEWGQYWLGRIESETDDFAAQFWAHAFAVEPDVMMTEWAMRANRAHAEMRSADHLWYVTIAEPMVQAGVLGASISRVDGAASLAAWSMVAQQSRVGDVPGLIRQSVEALRSALDVVSIVDGPELWAGIQNSLGNALFALGERGDTQAVQDAVDAYRLALMVYTRELAPADWAMTQNNLGNALAVLGERGDDRELEGAVAAFRLALDVYTREASPVDWAMIQNNLGNALQISGARGKTQALGDAVAAYRLALEVYTREAVPAQWAMTQNNLGNALQALGDAEAMRDAIAAFRLALEVLTREAAPAQWAMTQSNLGNALQALGDPRALMDAVVAYRLALEVYTREQSPIPWANTEHNLGNALQALGMGSDSRELEDAIVAYRQSLEVFTREESPTQWAMTQERLGIAVLIQATWKHDPEATGQAIEAFDCAAEGYALAGLPDREPRVKEWRMMALQLLESLTPEP